MAWNANMSGGEGNALSERLRLVAVFGRSDTLDDYWFIGQGHLVGFGAQQPGSWLFRYHVEPRLSRELWIEFGGYKDWLLTIGRKDFLVRTAEDVIALLDSEWGGANPEVHLTRYEGDSLQSIVNNKNEAVVSYCPGASAPELFSGNFDPNGPWVSFARSDGYEWNVPSSTIVSRDLAVQIIQACISKGRPIGLPGIP
jgi:hypothetical protein